MDDFRLLIIQAGGTIDKDYPKRKGGYAFEICESGAAAVLDKVRPSFPYRLVTVCREDSQDLTDQHRTQILMTCMEAGEKFLLITHGTDTILQTATFLSKHLFGQTTSSCIAVNETDQSGTSIDKVIQSQPTTSTTDHQSPAPGVTGSQSAVAGLAARQAAGDGDGRAMVATSSDRMDKRIVITGAFLPERFKETDADFNVGVAVGAMQGGLPPGVFVSLGGRVWPWNKVKRADSGQYVSI